MKFMQTDNLNIRRLKPDDWKDLYPLLSDAEAQKYQNKGVYGEEECIQEVLEMSKYNTNWSVCMINTNEVVGFIKIEQIEPMNSRTFKLHFNMQLACCDNGIALETNTRMLQYAFEELSAHRVVGMTCAQDYLSNRVYSALKMRKEGSFQKAYTYRSTKTNRPIWWDIYLFAMLKDEWLKIVR